MRDLKLVVDNKNVMPKTSKPNCTVTLEDTKCSYDDFIAVGFNMETGKAMLLHNADAITIAYAKKLIEKAFVDSYNELSPEHKEVVDKYLNDIKDEDISYYEESIANK